MASLRPREEDLDTFFRAFVAQMKWPIQLLTGNKAKIFAQHCMNQTESGSIVKLVMGISEELDYGLVAMRAKDINPFLEYRSLINSGKFYQFIHAICPYVIDPWNLLATDSVINCYYRDFGDLATCPSTYSGLIKLFAGMFNYRISAFNASKVDLKPCDICHETVHSHQVFGFCMICRCVVHFSCMKTWVQTKSKPTFQCILCQTEFKNQNLMNSKEGFVIVYQSLISSDWNQF